ncbi:hypothetical protein GII30_01175 [Gordonia amarae]|uniref:Uncharacterized protein n=2 Tax=Gordonia amarae TaxID=36821 RepID=G7GUW9_9ACTN|nr:hypothetical protein [Gordonia amarae]MCS3876956.1 hypothetical protein [Gordonia amarae]QHN15779.1 hypothetical protein GII35_01175 [Gordonia amarae]QHN20347.1 hypothetical protein GII34_01175 [Gordonia amarae]QHN29199.1 hypothetical protein GII32_01180 [Gordonia amarae]QHN37978.1 hypothetical protein GII30_01175 [Gordonia amarae]
MAGSVHSGDPRTKQQRRAYALVALAKGRTVLPCLCAACVAMPVGADAYDLTGTDPDDDEVRADRAADCPQKALG